MYMSVIRCYQRLAPTVSAVTSPAKVLGVVGSLCGVGALSAHQLPLAPTVVVVAPIPTVTTYNNSEQQQQAQQQQAVITPWSNS